MKRQFMLALLVFVTILCSQSSRGSEDADDTVNVDRSCPLFKCVPCPNDRYVIDQYGCRTCECNPCRFGHPQYQYSCGTGEGICTANKGLCKVGTADIVYCCPKERPGCCPPSPPGILFCPKFVCDNDYNCPVGQKCCTCGRCANATNY